MNFQTKNKVSQEVLRNEVNQIIDTFRHPTLNMPLSQVILLQHIFFEDKVLCIEIVMPFPWKSGFDALKESVSHELCTAFGADRVVWKLQHNVATLKRANEKAITIKGIRNIIAISSAKGGVGKSSIAVNLALALIAEGGNVGILDADIYGPSVPSMLGTGKKLPGSTDNHHMTPVMAYGMPTNSIGYFITNDNAAIWRGPMASKVLVQLLQDTAWPELDYLVIDLPPGTGDIQLTLAQTIPVTFAVVVTTPQDIALHDVEKGIILFQKVNVPVLGIIENMSVHICSQCGFHEKLFGSVGADHLIKKYNTRLLGKLPLDINFREDLDKGMPTVSSRPDSPLTRLYRQIASDVASQMYWNGTVVQTEIPLRVL